MKSGELPKSIFVICPVRRMTRLERQFLTGYIDALEKLGVKVHFPPRDTKQDQKGLQICTDNMNAMRDAEEVHIYYNDTSSGSKFDLGMVLAMEKPLYCINAYKLERTPKKSFTNLVLDLHAEYERQRGFQ